ncbi:tRNA (34-2'-O)-methyltransferase regulator WDR6-like, partial [Centruroides vittatus]|uniref:tRNA (34-2'-O)-methyltransferase regulator WDR6-like n=1 Tax=Centruroides vittatus TaxID=120091 RepID=UPI003510AC11
ILTCYEIANNQQNSGNKLFKKPWIQKNCAALLEPQTRYLDACIWEYSQKDVYMIAVACSDAVLRFFKFSLSNKELQLYKTVPHGNYCILHTSLICIQKSIMVFTGSTDGLLKIFSSDFNIKENTSEIEKQTNLSTIICPELITEKKLHQCGINAMCLHKLSDSTLLLFTGGDDNSLNSSVITVNNQSVDIKTFTCPTAHYAQITGISVLSENKILTTSIDQRIHLWNWEFDKETKKLNLNLLTTFMSCIPDIACLNVYKRKNHWIAVVCGQGLEAFSID